MDSNLIIGLTVSIFVVAFGLVYKGIELTNPPHSVEYRNAPKSDYQANYIVDEKDEKDEWSRNNNQNEANKTGGRKSRRRGRSKRRKTHKKHYKSNI